MGGGRGRYISNRDKQEAICLIQESKKNGARISKACEIMEISTRTYQRWLKDMKDRRKTRDYTPSNKLTEQERNRILEICNSKEFQDMPPSQIVPILAERGIYIASERTFYRVLKEEGQLTHRHRSMPRLHHKPTHFKATGPNQVWSWDITYLPTNVRGMFYYLYMFIDVFSRKIVGSEVYEVQSDHLASKVLRRCCIKERIMPEQLVLHSNSGGPMKGSTMLATLRRLRVCSSFSRPGVSNDNPFIESFFRTYKYCPRYPNFFKSLEQARKWTSKFVKWYNNEHRHSGIKFVTPNQRHEGKDIEILKARDMTYKKARVKYPERWTTKTRNWEPIEVVHLNPGNKNYLKAA